MARMSDEQFLEIAAIGARSSNCVSMVVGCVIVSDNRPVSIGYNGTAPGFDNCCDVHKERGPEHSAWSERFEVHAEMNAILFAARKGIALEGCVVYSTIEPCFNCLKHMKGAGIKEIVYADDYYRETPEGREEKAEYCRKVKIIYRKKETTS